MEALEPRQMLSAAPAAASFSAFDVLADHHDHGHRGDKGDWAHYETHWIGGERITLVADPAYVGAAIEPAGASPTAENTALYPLTSIPNLHSDPTATVKVYLDFDGHFEAQWGGHTNVATPVYDRDGDPTTFSDQELNFITMAWAKVTEDFAPFSIDVTTEEPPELAPGAPESAANGVALRVSIGGDGSWTGGNYGGIAQFDSFTNSAPNVVYVFPAGTGDGRYEGDVSSHEAGHAFGLSHQSLYDAQGNLVNTYHPGDGYWAPIMGYTYAPVTTWHNGTSSSATTYQDDMAMIARPLNGFGFRADDHGNTLATASHLAFDGASATASGLIGQNSDVDYWSFTAPALDTYRLRIDPAAVGPNLDALLELRDAAGALIASASPVASQAAELLLPLGPATYFLSVAKTAAYGWLGQYTLEVSTPAATVLASANEPVIVPERSAAGVSFTLQTQPTADVTIPLAVSDPSQATLSAASLAFTPLNWNVPQTVTISGIDDGVVDDDVPFIVAVGPATSADAEYNGLDPNDVSAVSTDHGYGGYAYWTDRMSDLVQRSSLGGGPVETLVDLKALYGGTPDQYNPRGMALDLAGGKMYWVDHNAGRVQRANLDGSNAEILLSGFGNGTLVGIELDLAAGKMYWTNYSAGTIQRANLDGSGVENLVSGQNGVWDVLLDTSAGKMYWSTWSAGVVVIRRADLNGSGAELLWTSQAASAPTGLALDLPADKLYWYEAINQQILRSDLDGTDVQTVVDLSTIALLRVHWINVDSRAGKLYWSDLGNGAIYRSNLDGSNMVRLVSGLAQPQQMVIVEPAVSVTPHTGLVTSESGAAASFQVALTTPPAADVTIPLSTGDATEGSVSAASLTFTPANWNVPQTVAVTGVNDAIFDGDVAYTVVLGVAASSDPDYAGVDPRDVSLTNFDNEVKFYVVNDATTNISYKYGADGSARGNTTLGSGNNAPRGVAGTILGDKTWVVDANRNVYVYNAASGSLLGSWTAGSLASNATLEGIATNGTDVWLVDSRSDRVYRYAGAASRLSGSQTATSNFNLASGNSNAKDIVTDGASLWVVDDAKTDRVFKYSLAGSLAGSWTIDAANKTPTGITIDPSSVSHIWIVDSGTDRVYQYNGAASRTSGSQSAALSFALAAGNANPQGIADPPSRDAPAT
ncbi:MAG: hypothetical protein DCC67_19700, partial [Planctomycetota bacterium]